MTIKNIGIAALVVGVLLGVASFFGVSLHFPAPHALGTAGNAPETHYNGQWLIGGNQIGLTGTWNTNQQFGTCNLIGGAGGITATSTANFDCAVTGIKPGDTLVEDPSNNMALGIAGDIFPIRATASTTAGYITFTLLNLSGAASTTLGSQVTSGVEYISWR